jgi:PadR family transcriptional regulator, regulatory protein PadR
MVGGLEQMVLLGILHLEGVKDGAYAVGIRRELEQRSGKRVSRGALYTVLERLESKGYLASRLGSPTAERGGKRKRFYRVTPSGVKALRSSKDAMVKLWQGLESVLGKTS